MSQNEEICLIHKSFHNKENLALWECGSDLIFVSLLTSIDVPIVALSFKRDCLQQPTPTTPGINKKSAMAFRVEERGIIKVSLPKHTQIESFPER